MVISMFRWPLLLQLNPLCTENQLHWCSWYTKTNHFEGEKQGNSHLRSRQTSRHFQRDTALSRPSENPHDFKSGLPNSNSTVQRAFKSLTPKKMVICTCLWEAGSINGHLVQKTLSFLYDIMVIQPRQMICMPHALRDQALHIHLYLILWALLQCHNENKITAFKCSYWDNHIQRETTRKPESSNAQFTVKRLMLTGSVSNHILHCRVNSIMLYKAVPLGRPIFCY